MNVRSSPPGGEDTPRVGDLHLSAKNWTLAAGALSAVCLGFSFRLAVACGYADETMGVWLLIAGCPLLGSAIGLGFLWFILAFSHCFVF